MLTVVYLTPRNILAFELGPFGEFDARYLKWLADVVVKGPVECSIRVWLILLVGLFLRTPHVHFL